MPELPEVETIRRQLAPVVEGMTIAAAEVVDPRWVAPADPGAFERAVCGRVIDEMARRGKYFVIHLSDGPILLMHLRMTGNLLLVPEDEDPPGAHIRGRLWLEGGGRGYVSLAFNDPRRFGTAEILGGPKELADRLDDRLGPEPFSPEFDGDRLHARSRGRHSTIKALLLDQSTVAGVGNIYADEALFRAGISPRRKAGRISRKEAERLADTVRDALAAGIDAKGATIDDFRDAYGAMGSFQDQFLVHRREGLPCSTCEATIVKIRCAGRGTYLCPNCQR